MQFLPQIEPLDAADQLAAQNAEASLRPRCSRLVAGLQMAVGLGLFLMLQLRPDPMETGRVLASKALDAVLGAFQ